MGTESSGGAPGSEARRVLRRSTGQDRMVAGVCAGIARYLGVDVVVVRLGFVVLTVAGGGGIILYVVGLILMPEERPGEPVGEAREGSADTMWLIAGVGLIALGSILLIDRIVPWFGRIIGPLALVGLGIALLLHGSRR